MGLDLWFREDVARILAALSSAGEQYGPAYQKALADVAIAFGVIAPGGTGNRRGYSVEVLSLPAPAARREAEPRRGVGGRG